MTMTIDRTLILKLALTTLTCLQLVWGDSVPSILVVGSINADTFLPVSRLPTEGENISLRRGCDPTVDVPGGKGCTQAVAACKLCQKVAFVGQFGNDAAASVLRKALRDAKVDISNCQDSQNLPSGRGYVFITDSGSVSAVVSGGSNTAGWKAWERAWQGQSTGNDKDQFVSKEYLDNLLDNVKCVMLQREIPEYVNKVVATEARRRGILVLQDVGGEDRPLDREMMELCDYLIPNETELSRLIQSLGEDVQSNHDTESIVSQAKLLQNYGARNVLVTRGSQGSTLLTESGNVLHQKPCSLGGSEVVDETGAGDCFRAAFAVALLEGHSLQHCLEYASAAGACSVTKSGAVPSTPSRKEVERMLQLNEVTSIPRGGTDEVSCSENEFPLMFGSRLNSMKDRPELWPDPLTGVRDWVKRQGDIRGLNCVDFNYPQHFHTWTSREAKAALDEVGLVAGAVCLRFPPKFARGAMNHPDPELRREAIDLTKQAAQVAIDLGCSEVVVWSAYDGYDYPFQVDYDEKWAELVEAFRECCDAFPDIDFSLEFKPTDENTRFFTVPSTGAALLLVKEIDRPNMGLTLDIGHMLMAGENPGQSIAMVGKKLFGIQLNDGYTRLAAEDGMMFGSIHPSIALEIVYQLQRIGYSGHLYFDTFPQRTDPVKEAEYNIERVKRFWAAARTMSQAKLRQATANHDAIEALELVNEALRRT